MLFMPEESIFSFVEFFKSTLISVLLTSHIKARPGSFLCFGELLRSRAEIPCDFDYLKTEVFEVNLIPIIFDSGI